MAYDRSVFVNCPFDTQYSGLLWPLLFTIIYLGMKPRIALESMDSGRLRLAKIIELIRESKYSIHDLSRSEATAAGELYRLNVAFELGIDLGCRLFGQPAHRAKRALVLEETRFRYQAALSDLAGVDMECHEGKSSKVFGIVRNWLKNVCLKRADGAARIRSAYYDYMSADIHELTGEGFSAEDIESLQVGELIERMESWVAGRTSR